MLICYNYNTATAAATVAATGAAAVVVKIAGGSTEKTGIWRFTCLGVLSHTGKKKKYKNNV